MIEELLAAFIVGISFSNTFICMLLGFGATSVERKETGKYFIFGRFLGVVMLGLIIASLGLILIGVMNYLMIIFGILTITFGIIIFYNIYHKFKQNTRKQKIASCNTQDNNTCSSCAAHKNSAQTTSCESCTSTTCTAGNNEHVCKTIPKSMQGTKLTKRYSFILGLFRGATPCLKMIIIAPLLIVTDFWTAVVMVLIFAASSTLYTIIGFVSASVLINFKKYESYVQVAGACILIAIGIFTIATKILVPACELGI